MNEYVIYCTEEQTKKALELGASIENTGIYQVPQWVEINGTTYIIPTAEEMIGWLEDKFICSITITFDSRPIKWKYENWGKHYDYYDYEDGFSTRKEATIAAIDAALVYLSDK